jgi:hypothetical protein
VKTLQAQVTQIHVSARGGATEHNLLREDIENAPLHCRLEIAGCSSKVARDDDENVIEGACGLQTNGLRCGGMAENEDEM